MSFILQRNTFWHRETKGLALSHTAREQQIGSQVGSFLTAESSEGLQPCTQELPRTIVSDQMLFPKHRSQLRRSGRPFSRLAACAAMPPTQGEESWGRLKRSNELIHTEMWVTDSWEQETLRGGVLLREEGERETLAVLTLSRNSLPAGEKGRGESEGSMTWP